MSNADNWDDYAHDNDTASAAVGRFEALQREVADLREMLSDKMDSAEEIAIEDNRRALRERADKEARAEAAVNNPATLEALRKIDNEADLVQFLRDHGGQ